MYPLVHRRAVRWLRSSSRPSFDPLAIDLLAIVVVDGEEPLEEGEIAPEALENLDGGGDGSEDALQNL
ncbi:hypothetical protein AMTR_s00023p00241850 [Amborella trichopoda]|uniref:Uncharacterized protein n=1 Tax=Amborella trichopoda TaxID=13333 RepID=W1NJX0_AMBTC|nr:hypothetical protein AMTR_s00023p00241850 [Amborella trichopoda]